MIWIVAPLVGGLIGIGALAPFELWPFGFVFGPVAGWAAYFAWWELKGKR